MPWVIVIFEKRSCAIDKGYLLFGERWHRYDEALFEKVGEPLSTCQFFDNEGLGGSH